MGDLLNKLVPVEGEEGVLVRESAVSKSMAVFESMAVMGNMVESDANDGTGLIRIITPGQGSSGYYPKEVIKRDGPKIFQTKTHMYWNHSTEEEKKRRPEGHLDLQAGAITGPAYWDEAGPVGPGVYAPYKALSEYKTKIKERAELGLIEISWNGWVTFTEGQVAGKPTKIVQQMTAAESVDFVTRAGAGGAIARASEAAANRQDEKKEGVMDVSEQDYAALKARADAATALEARVATMLAESNAAKAKAAIEAKLGKLKLAEKAQERTVNLFLAVLPMKEGALDLDKLNADLDAYVADFGPPAQSQESASGKVKLAGETSQEVPKADPTKFAKAFESIGMDAKKAELAAKGGR